MDSRDGDTHGFVAELPKDFETMHIQEFSGQFGGKPFGGQMDATKKMLSDEFTPPSEIPGIYRRIKGL
jgi:hypothetical protein